MPWQHVYDPLGWPAASTLVALLPLAVLLGLLAFAHAPALAAALAGLATALAIAIGVVGMPADAAVAAPLLKGECKATKMAVYLYVGPYEKVGDAYGKVFQFIEQNGYKMAGPAMEKYLDMNPQAVKPEDLKTEINVPVEKK